MSIAPVYSPPIPRLHSVQILRGLATAFIVYFHIEPPWQFGAFSVDIFFIISGFVMALVLTTRPPIQRFAYDRLTRIVPLYWLFTTLVLVGAYFRPELFNATTANAANYLKSLFFIPYFKENANLHPMLAVGWTLNYEILFYGLIAAVLIFTRRHVAVWVALAFLALFIGLGHGTSHPVLNHFFGAPLVFEFSLGMLAYCLYTKRIGFGWHPMFYGGIVLSAVIALIWIEMQAFHQDRFTLFGALTFLVFYSVLALEHHFTTWPQWLMKPLLALGEASYAIYLSHLFVVEGIRAYGYERWDIIDPQSLIGMTIIMMVALFTGHFIHKRIDLPCQRALKPLFKSRVA